jgi:hypothetical protein
MAQVGRPWGSRMSKEDFERLYETPVPTGSAAQASLLERATIVTLACSALASFAGIVFTALDGATLARLL